MRCINNNSSSSSSSSPHHHRSCPWFTAGRRWCAHIRLPPCPLQLRDLPATLHLLPQLLSLLHPHHVRPRASRRTHPTPTHRTLPPRTWMRHCIALTTQAVHARQSKCPYTCRMHTWALPCSLTHRRWHLRPLPHSSITPNSSLRALRLQRLPRWQHRPSTFRVHWALHTSHVIPPSPAPTTSCRSSNSACTPPMSCWRRHAELHCRLSRSSPRAAPLRSERASGCDFQACACKHQ